MGGAQVEFMRRLGLGQRLADHGAELEAQQNALASQVGTLTGVLAQSREQLALSRERDHSAATTGLRAQLDLVLGQTLARLEQLATSTPSVAAEIGTLRRTLRAALLELLDEALCAAAPMRVAGAPADANDTKLDLLERRVRKLNAQLLESQELLARTRAGQSELQGAVPSIHRVAQGLRSDATDGQAKRSLLQAIFEHNLELRRTLADQPDPHAAPTGAGSK
ncbi:MAG: hypothetical protein EXS13_00705 [Planctomycetes bacterium]|nr:hypothetical protein [Planctomycetota bacterium]